MQTYKQHNESNQKTYKWIQTWSQPWILGAGARLEQPKAMGKSWTLVSYGKSRTISKVTNVLMVCML